MPDIWSEHGEGLFFDGASEPEEEQSLTDVPETLPVPLVFTVLPQFVLCQFTKDDIKKILSALENGARLTYPESWQDVIWLFQQWLEYPLSIDDDEFTIDMVRMYGNGWTAQTTVSGGFTVLEPVGFDNDFGNPKSSIRAAAVSGATNGRYVRLYVYLDNPTDINSVSFEYYALHAATPTNSQRDIVFFDADDNQLALTRTTSNTWSTGSWQTFQHTTPVANVSYFFITLTLRKASWAIADASAWLDNIQVN